MYSIHHNIRMVQWEFSNSFPIVNSFRNMTNAFQEASVYIIHPSLWSIIPHYTYPLSSVSLDPSIAGCRPSAIGDVDVSMKCPHGMLTLGVFGPLLNGNGMETGDLHPADRIQPPRELNPQPSEALYCMQGAVP